MNYNNQLRLGLKLQGINPDNTSICFDLHLKEDYLLPYCFLLDEEEDSLLVVTTTEQGREEVRLIPKDNILFTAIVYEVEDLFNPKKLNEDCMYE